MTLALCGLLTTYAVLLHPGYLTNYQNLGGFLFLEIMAVAVYSYRQWFLPLVLVVFSWSGINLPMHDVFTVARWAILGAGAAVGLVLYLKRRQPPFGLLQLVGFLCSLTAFMSALKSAYPSVAALKALSLFLLFLFAATGGRMAALGREASFMSRFLMATEFVVFATAVSYFGFHFPIYGNPNALGTVMSVIAVPLTLWGVLVAERSSTRAHRGAAFLLAAVLLLSSYERAGIAAAFVSSILICIALRKYAALARGVFLAAVLMILVNTLMPEQVPDQTESQPTIAAYLYKGHKEVGLFGSRKSVWDRTGKAIRQSPFLGSGFGTSASDGEKTTDFGNFSSTTEVTREHGNSYLAITEWVGLLGVLPFLALLLILVTYSVRVLRFLRRAANPRLIVVPLAAVVIAGLVHAGFEDWLFAPGYYLCVLYWTVAFVFVDVASVAIAAQDEGRMLEVRPTTGPF
jgi:O-antigen ligase